MKKLIFILVLFFLSSCGGGGGGSTPPAKHAPVISDLYPTSLILYQSSGTTVKNFSFYATFKSCLTAYMDVTDNNSVLLASTSMQIAGSCGESSGTITINIPIDTSDMTAGESGFINFSVSDDTSLRSNNLIASWNVF